MANSAIKVIKKSAMAMVPKTKVVENSEKQSFSKKTAHTIEHNIKSWIEELQVRKNDDLLHAHSLMSGQF